MERKLNFFEHECRMNDDRLIKTVIFSDMKGTNRRGRPRREWLNDIQVAAWRSGNVVGLDQRG